MTNQTELTIVKRWPPIFRPFNRLGAPAIYHPMKVICQTCRRFIRYEEPFSLQKVIDDEECSDPKCHAPMVHDQFARPQAFTPNPEAIPVLQAVV